jgi:hypothetical protein
MSQDFIQLADRTKLGSDSKSISLGTPAVAHILDRQQLVSVPGTVPAQQAIALGEAILEYLGGVGAPDANVDGSGAPITKSYVVAADKALVLDEITLMIRDTGTFNGSTFGAIAGPLANGIKLEVLDTDGNTSLKSFIPNASAKKNADLAAIPGAELVQIFADTLQVRIPTRFEGWPLLVAAGQYVRLTVRDNLTGLDGFQASIRGRLSSVS